MSSVQPCSCTLSSTAALPATTCSGGRWVWVGARSTAELCSACLASCVIAYYGVRPNPEREHPNPKREHLAHGVVAQHAQAGEGERLQPRQAGERREGLCGKLLAVLDGETL